MIDFCLLLIYLFICLFILFYFVLVDGSKEDQEKLASFFEKMDYVSGLYDQPEGYIALNKRFLFFLLLFFFL